MKAGLRVLVTRPDPRGSTLCEKLKQAGLAPLSFPTIAFETMPYVSFENVLRTLTDQNWLIFVSPQAVNAGLPIIKQAHPTLPSYLKWAAVGAGTAAALRLSGQATVLYPPSHEGSEALLALSSFQEMQDQNVLLIKGEGGRSLLSETLALRGARVTELNVYKRILPTLSADAKIFLLRPNEIDAIVCTAYEGVRNLKTLLFNMIHGDVLWESFKMIPLVVVSNRIKKLAHALGFQRIWVAAAANDSAILEALTLCYGEIYE